MPVAVVVEKSAARTPADLCVIDTRFASHVREGAVAIVVEQVVAFSRQTEWTTHCAHSAKLAGAGCNPGPPCNRRMFGIKFHIAGNKQIEQPVMIEVSPGRASGPATESDASFFGHIGERAVMMVVIKTVSAEIGDVDVRPPVVIVITYGYAEAPAFIGYACMIGGVGECAIVIIVKQHRSGRGFLSFLRGKRGAVEQVDVEPSVIVVIQQSDARTGSFKKGGLLWTSGAVMKLLETGLLGSVGEHRGRAVHEAASSDGTRQGVFHRRMRSAG